MLEFHQERLYRKGLKPNPNGISNGASNGIPNVMHRNRNSQNLSNPSFYQNRMNYPPRSQDTFQDTWNQPRDPAFQNTGRSYSIINNNPYNILGDNQYAPQYMTPRTYRQTHAPSLNDWGPTWIKH